MGKITGIAHIAITVTDMKKSLDFYTRVLGFRKAFSFSNPKTGEPWIEYIYMGDGQFVELFYGGIKDNPWSGELRGFNHICLQVDDIHSVVEHVKKEGVEITDELKQGLDGNWQAWIKDPDGIRIEFMQIDERSPHYKAMRELA
jgi:lactoylglutathione lyase